METDVPKLPSDVETLQAMVTEQSATIASLTTKLSKLEHYLEQLVRARYGPRSEKGDPHQLVLFDTAATAQKDASQPAQPSVRVKEYQRGGGGRQELPEHLERRVVEHDLAAAAKCCPECGTERERIGCDQSEQLEYEPAVLYVLVHRRWKYACRRCGEHVATAPPAAKPIEKGLPGPGLLAAVVTGKYSDHLPLYRLEDVFFRSGVELARSTLSRWALQTAELVRPLYELMIEEVLQSRVIHTDDTPMPVLDPDLPHTRTARLWTYVGDWRHPLTVYDYTTSRKRDGPQQFLNGYVGYLQADAYGGYEGIYAGGLVQQVLCWAHARRKFYEARTVAAGRGPCGPGLHRSALRRGGGAGPAALSDQRDVRPGAGDPQVAPRAQARAPAPVTADPPRVPPVAGKGTAHRAPQEPGRPGDWLRAAPLGRPGALLRGRLPGH